MINITTDLANLVDTALVDEEAGISKQTLLIIDCRALNKSTAKSLLIQSDGRMLVSNKETARLINQFLDRQPIGLLLAKSVLNLLKINAKVAVPYVFGSTILLPLGGYTRHSTSWIMLGNVFDLNFLNSTTLCLTAKETKQSYLIEANKTSFLTNFKNALEIHDVLQTLSTEMLKQCPIKQDLPPQLLRWSLDNQPSVSLHAFMHSWLLTITKAVYRSSGDNLSDEYLTEICHEIVKLYDKLN